MSYTSMVSYEAFSEMIATFLHIIDLDPSTNTMHRKCNVERLAPRRKRHLAALIYKVAQDPRNRILQRNRTRSDKKVKLRVERPTQEKYKKGPLYLGMQLCD